MKIRLMGTADEINTASAVLHAYDGLRIVAVSRPYLNRDNPAQLRVYLDAHLMSAHDLPEDTPQ